MTRLGAGRRRRAACSVAALDSGVRKYKYIYEVRELKKGQWMSARTGRDPARGEARHFKYSRSY